MYSARRDTESNSERERERMGEYAERKKVNSYIAKLNFFLHINNDNNYMEWSKRVKEQAGKRYKPLDTIY